VTEKDRVSSTRQARTTGLIFSRGRGEANGVPNAVTASGPARGVISDYQRFRRLTELFQYAQDHEMASIRTELRDTEMTRLLNLRPGQLDYDVVVAPGVVPDPLLYPRPPSTELRISPRSTSQVFFYLSNGVEVPCEHLESGLVRPTSDAEGRPMDGRELTRGLFEVHSCKGHKPPPTAYVAVKNRGYWYYIDDRDQASKSTLALVLQLSRLDFGNQKAAGPLLTLPVGR
jgi:hypothetical protein